MNDHLVDPYRLELLLELSRLGSMREVGEAMHVTTSTVSQQIAALAREAGTPLVEPDGRRVRLTPAGRRLAGHAVTILAAVEAARRDLDPEAPPAGTVRVAAYASAFRQVLLPVVGMLAGRLDQRRARLPGQRRDLLRHGGRGDLHRLADLAHRAEAGQLEQQLETARVHESIIHYP